MHIIKAFQPTKFEMLIAFVMLFLTGAISGSGSNTCRYAVHRVSYVMSRNLVRYESVWEITINVDGLNRHDGGHEDDIIPEPYGRSYALATILDNNCQIPSSPTDASMLIAQKVILVDETVLLPLAISSC